MESDFLKERKKEKENYAKIKGIERLKNLEFFVQILKEKKRIDEKLVDKNKKGKRKN